MADWLGWTGLLVAGSVTLLLATKYRPISGALAIAFSARASAALFHFYIAPLPDGTADAVTFERYAWEWGRDGLLEAFNHFPGLDAYFYAWLMSLVYAVSDRNLLLLQSINVLAGVLGVLVTFQLVKELWGVRDAAKAAWVMALFPALVQYGALPMREAGFLLFLMIGFLGVVRWSRYAGWTGLGFAAAGFSCAAFFHGGAFVALIGLVGVIGLSAFRRCLEGLLRGKIPVIPSLAILLVAVLIVVYVGSELSIHKLGTATEMVSAERWMHYFQSRVYGNARYPEWIQPESSADLIWSVPVRAVYLLSAPFPWDLREPAHLIGLIDGLLYFALLALIWRHRSAVWADPGARTLLLILVPLVLAFGVGSGNFGTGLRHRAKLVGVLVALAAPRMPRLVLTGREERRAAASAQEEDAARPGWRKGGV